MMIPADHPMFTPVLRRKDLIASGLDDTDVVRMCRSGEIERVRYGSYVSGADWRMLDDAGRYAVLCRAVQGRAQSDLVLSHVSALPFYGAPLWGFDLSTVHGTRLDGRAGRKEAGVQQHAGLLLDEDVVAVGGAVITTPVRACLDVTTIARAEVSLCVVNHMLHTGQVDVATLRSRYQSQKEVTARDGGARSTSMAHWPHTGRTDVVLRLATPKCESVAESRFWHFCWVHALPMPEPQHEVRDHHGRVVARLDFAWPEIGVFLEFDGRVKYTGLLRPGETAADAVLREKRREDLVRELTGWRCIRITWADLEHPQRTAARLRRMLLAAPVAG